jgi:hypothetical protein
MALRPAHAYEIVPPKKFDYPFPGNLIITRVSEFDAHCPREAREFGDNLLGCARPYGSVCKIYIAPDETLALRGLKYEDALRHEVAHCNGWIHDRDGNDLGNDPFSTPR